MQLKAYEIKELTKNPDGTYRIVSKRSKNGHKFFTTPWQNVPRYDSAGNLVDPEEFKSEQIRKYGLVYWRSNYENDFIGSSETLIDPDILHKIVVSDPIDDRDGLKIYKLPEKDHKYIMAVDPSKEGEDAFAVQVIDITEICFEQVASASLQVNYMGMPDFLCEWGTMYNTAYMIVENNEGAGQSVADFLRNQYEYGHLYYDQRRIPNTNTTRPQTYPGFRTTKKTRRLILDALKLFMNNGKLTIHDSKTLQELLTFIKLNGKYQADLGYHDDSVMALAIAFAPFANTNNFSDVKAISEAIKANNSEVSDFNLNDYIDIGDFQDFTDDSLGAQDSDYGFMPIGAEMDSDDFTGF